MTPATEVEPWETVGDRTRRLPGHGGRGDGVVLLDRPRAGAAVTPEPIGSRNPVLALEALAREAGAIGLAHEAATLAVRVSERRFHVAVIGQFKRGKSTLINALVGDAILPTGVTPVTSIVTVVRHGPRRGARVRFMDGSWNEIDPSDLQDYVSEVGNPDNERRVAGVEVFVPGRILASGMCLVDTPGLGSVFTAGSAATRDFVPHIDAALVVVGADPPISHAELVLVEEVGRQVTDLVVILNKADRVTDLERRAARTFTEQVLARRLGRPIGAILEVSATERLAGASIARDWEALDQTLARLSEEAGGYLVAAAERRGLLLLAERLRREIDEEHAALVRPVEASERRIDALRVCRAEAERAMGDLGHLLTAEQERLAGTFAGLADAFLERSTAEARREIAEAVRSTNGRAPALRAAAVALAQDISRRWLERWRAEVQPAAESLYRQATERFVLHANGFLARFDASADAAASGEPALVGPEIGFRVRSRLHYTDLWGRARPSPFARLIDPFRSRERLLAAVTSDAGAYLAALLETNTARIKNDLNHRVLESRRLLEGELRAHIEHAHGTAGRALQRARAAQAAGRETVDAEKARLAALRRRLETLIAHRAEEGADP